MLCGKLRWLPLALYLLAVTASAQEAKLEAGKAVEREIAGGETHSYQIKLTSRQFVHATLNQVGIDLKLSFAEPDGKQVVEVDLNRTGPEALSAEPEVSADYRLVVRAIGPPSLRGSYVLRVEVRAETTAADKQRIAAERLMIEADALLKDKRTAQQALEKSTRALELWRKTGDSFWEARVLMDIGYAYRYLYRWDKAIESYERALNIARALGDPTIQARLLLGLGFAFQGTDRQQEALGCFERALVAAREAKDRVSEGQSLNYLGFANASMGRNEKAIGYYEQALASLRELANERGQADSLFGLGNANFSMSRYQKATEYYQQSLEKYRGLKDRAGEGTALMSLGNGYFYLSGYEKAIEYYEQARVINIETKNREGEGYTLLNLSFAYGGLGRYEKALQYAEEALAISREVKSRTSEAYALGMIAGLQGKLGSYEKTVESLERALVINREVKNRSGEAGILSGLGNAYRNLGHYEKAIECFEQAYAISNEIKSRGGQGWALSDIGQVYWYINRNEKAIENYEKALEIFREVKNRIGQGGVLLNLGLSYRYLGRYDKAIEYYEQALVIHREVQNREDEGWTLNNLGSPYRLMGQPQKAITYYEQALTISREIKNRSLEGNVLDSLGLAYHSFGRYDTAIEFFNQALAIYRDIKNQGYEVTVLKDLASSERAQGNLLAARSHIEESLHIAESLRAGFVSPESRASFLSSVQDAYQLYTDLLMRQHRAEPTKGFDALAVETSERQRARSLLDTLIEARADLRQGVDPALLERERVLAKQLNDKARTQTSTPEQAAALKQEISQLETDLERAQAAIRKASPRFAALVQPQPLKLREIQQQLDADTLLLEYALGEERSYLWAITRDSLTSYELPKGELIEKSARQVYELLTARSTIKRGEAASQKRARISEAEANLPAAAQALSQTLLAPVAAQLGNKRLVIVADGALQYVPFAMLPTPVSRESRVGSRESQRRADSRPPLIVNHEVISLPSASALAIQRAELAGRKPAPKLLAVIADPVFDRADARLNAPVAETNDKAQAQAIAFDDARSLEHLAEKSDDKAGATTTRRLIIPRLPFTRQEATRLLALAPKNSSLGALDFQASRTTALDPALGQYRYLHFATHGYLDSERPGLSALLFSMLDAQGKPQNGFLRANDIYNLKLPAELVVLSACQTGLGKEIKGEGLVGLTRGFMHAGAARVVVSLWNVNDKATAELMTRFYEKMLKQGARPAAALRAAQVEMWRLKQWQSPYYWAAFTLQGEWR
jgi:CHAT domain-containing protein/tetratricopeptide (TPR) repeat protein